MQRIKILAENVSRGFAIAAPSFHLKKTDLAAGLPRFAHWGYPVLVDDRVSRKHRYLAGTDSERSQVLFDYLKNPQVGAIWCARGGYGATRLLPLLDKLGARKLLLRDPKLILGFSDITALHIYWNSTLGIPSIHCAMPTGKKFHQMTSAQHRFFAQTFAGKMEIGKAAHTARWRTKVWRAPKSNLEGKIIGGNLSLLATLAGTPWQPDLNGAFLFLEDCDERPYRVDRMLTQMENAGMLRGVRALLLGDFETDVKYQNPGEKKYWREIFLERFSCPVISELPVGHGAHNEPLPLGVKTLLNRQGKLELLARVVE